MKKLIGKAIEITKRIVFSVEPWVLVLALAGLGILGLFAMITYNQTNYFCQKCHKVLGQYRSIYLDSQAHEPFKKGEYSCMACHSDKDVRTWSKRQAKLWARGVEKLTQPTESFAFEVPIDDSKCLTCHYKILETNEMKYFEMPEKLAKIGLKFEHKRHLAFKSFTADDAEKLAALEAKANLSESERNELEFLKKVHDSSCDRCHEKKAALESGKVSIKKDINYFSRNPASCVTCHPDATDYIHPGTQKLAFPSEKNCRYCHRGKLHGKILFTLADKDSPDKTTCKICHPLYKPEEGGK